MHWGENYNLVHTLPNEERSTILHESCEYIAHWRKKYNLAQILHIGERSTILHKSCILGIIRKT